MHNYSNLPRQLRPSSAQNPQTTQPSHTKQPSQPMQVNQTAKYLQVTGNYKFFLDVKIQGEAPYQSSSIILNGFTKSDRKTPIPISFEWYRLRDDRAQHLQNIHENSYQTSPHDIGYTLKATIRSVEKGYEGETSILYGPVQIAPTLKSQVEEIVGSGEEPSFGINVLLDDDKGVRQKIRASMVIQKRDILINFPVKSDRKYQTLDGSRSAKQQYTERTTETLRLKYAIDAPIVEISERDSSKISLFYKGEEEDYAKVKNFITRLGRRLIPSTKVIRIEFTCESRETRDLILVLLTVVGGKISFEFNENGNENFHSRFIPCYFYKTYEFLLSSHWKKIR